MILISVEGLDSNSWHGDTGPCLRFRLSATLVPNAEFFPINPVSHITSMFEMEFDM